MQMMLVYNITVLTSGIIMTNALCSRLFQESKCAIFKLGKERQQYIHQTNTVL